MLAEFRARKLMDATRTFDVFSPDGDELGFFQKEFGKSLRPGSRTRTSTAGW